MYDIRRHHRQRLTLFGEHDKRAFGRNSPLERHRRLLVLAIIGAEEIQGHAGQALRLVQRVDEFNKLALQGRRRLVKHLFLVGRAHDFVDDDGVQIGL